MTDVSIVILTYKEAPAVLTACLKSLTRPGQASSGTSLVRDEIIVVDNAGNAATEKLVKEYLTDATYRSNEMNRGFAAAVNQGMKLATGRYVLLLNPDTVVPPDAIAKMVAHMDRDTEVGIGSCIIRYPNGELQDSIRRFPKLIDQLLIMLKVPHFVRRVRSIDDYMMRDVDPLQTQDVDSIMGAFMMIRRSVIDAIGLFDERYFIWFEEVDYCKMAHDAGFITRHYADVEIVHHKGHTFDQLATIRKQKWVRESMRKYFAKHHGVGAALVLWILAPVFIVLAYGAAVIKRG
ncbi:TPA: hypothetical protein DEP96_03150 [Candidatus Uhrbacteria bacterium]|nr:hypothetical protein [Candidatus Uhrbacteria bacterium]